MMPGPAPVTTIQSAAASLVARSRARRYTGSSGLVRAEPNMVILRTRPVGTEDPEGFGHLGQRSVGDLQVAHRCALAGEFDQRPDHGLQLPRLSGRQ